MRKLAVLLLVFVTSCVTIPRTEITPPTVWKLFSNTNSGSCFSILCESEGDLWRVLFLTSSHITEMEGVSWTASHHQGNILPAGTVLAFHPSEDACLMEFYSTEAVKVDKLSRIPVKYGETLFSSGYPGSQGPFLTHGLASIPGYYSVPTYMGSSGGPVSRENGEIVGLHKGVWIHNMTIIYFVGTYVPIVNILDWLEDELQCLL